MTDPVAQTTVQPKKPSLNVLSEPIFIHSLLIKPTRTDKQAVKAFRSGHDKPENKQPNMKM
jgi:hypothetical protein